MTSQNGPDRAHVAQGKTIRGIRNIAAYCGPGVSHYRVRDAIRSGELPVISTTSWTACRTSDVDAWIGRLGQPSHEDGAA